MHIGDLHPSDSLADFPGPGVSLHSGSTVLRVVADQRFTMCKELIDGFLFEYGEDVDKGLQSRPA